MLGAAIMQAHESFVTTMPTSLWKSRCSGLDPDPAERNPASTGTIALNEKSLPREEVRQASDRTEQRLGGGVPPFLQTSLGGGAGRLKHEALREEVHRFVEFDYTKNSRGCETSYCSAAMHLMRILARRLRQSRDAAKKQKARSRWAGFFHELHFTLRSERNRCAGDRANVATIDTEVVQLAIGHATQFVYRLTVLAPVVQGACYVHDDPLSGGSFDVSNPLALPSLC
jgi:hypothetical protein